MIEEKNYFADTSFLIDFIQERESAVRAMEKAQTVVTGSLCLFELGKKAEFDPSQFERFVTDFTVEDAEKAVELFREIQNEGEKINEIDYLIAAQALNRELEILTSDRDFRKVPNLETVFHREIE